MNTQDLEDFRALAHDEEWHKEKAAHRKRRIQQGIWLSCLIEFPILFCVWSFLHICTLRSLGLEASGLVFFFALLRIHMHGISSRILNLSRHISINNIEQLKQEPTVEKTITYSLDTIHKDESCMHAISLCSTILMLLYSAYVFVRIAI